MCIRDRSGSVTVDGVPMEEFDTTRLIAWMEQESILLTGTLRENLLAGSTRAIPETELMRACDLARFDWGKLAEGMDTYLGQNGSNLSAGDRQRVAAARTILLRRPFVVCDEPTSAQDPATAGPVMASLLSAQFDPAPGRPARRCTTMRLCWGCVPGATLAPGPLGEPTRTDGARGGRGGRGRSRIRGRGCSR